ncbi:MAG: ABC transporter ATP-binding protein [Armatimonadota bacterium]|nr:ABC transporter ATP-binding protein [Armatimonadota bacterium]
MLRAVHLTAGYGRLAAVRDVSLTVEAGELVAVVGANGAGKTTTLRVLSGLLRPWGGEVWFDGVRIDGRPAHEIVGRGLGHIPEGRRLFPEMTVRENLEMGAYPRHAKAARRQTLELVFTLFPVLRDRQRQLAGTLSGGEQQMLAIGRGLMGRPRLLLLDEPSIGLAPLMVARIFEVVAAINREGIAVLLVEQNVHHALQLARRAYVLEHGAVVAEGEGRALLQRDELRRACLGG